MSVATGLDLATMKASTRATFTEQLNLATTQQVLDVQQKYSSGASAALSIDVLRFLKSWLINHIQGSDQKYRPHLNAKGIV